MKILRKLFFAYRFRRSFASAGGSVLVKLLAQKFAVPTMIGGLTNPDHGGTANGSSKEARKAPAQWKIVASGAAGVSHTRDFQTSPKVLYPQKATEMGHSSAGVHSADDELVLWR